MDSSITIELRKKIIELAGQEVGRQIIDLLLKYGIKVMTELSSASIGLPRIEIKTIDPANSQRPSAAFRHMFECKINGESLGAMLQRVEIDPFDYSDGDLLRVKLTILPIDEGSSSPKAIPLGGKK